MKTKKQMLAAIQDLKATVEGFKPTQTVLNEQIMLSKELAIDAQVSNSEVYDGTIGYHTWIIINQWANYFANVFKYEADQMKHTLFINRAIRYAFIFGYVWIWNNNGTPEIVGASERNGKWYVSIIKEEFDNLEKSDSYYKRLEYNLEVDPKDLYRYKFDTLGFSAYIILGPVIKVEKLVSKALYNEILVLPTRLIHSSENPDPNNRAVKQILGFKSPILHKFADGQDKFEGMNLSITSLELLRTIEYTKNYYYDLLGRRTNTDYKASHSLDAEVEASQISFRILERERYLHLKAFLQWFSKQFATKIMLENAINDYQNVKEIEKIKVEEKENETIDN